MSKLEEKIENILILNKINFIREYSFSDVKRYFPLRFDFAIIENNQIKQLIEVQGEQHYKYSPYFHSNLKDFKIYQENDRKKISACLAKEIPLYCIPYYDIDLINSISDIFQEKYLAKTKFHNDLNNPFL